MPTQLARRKNAVYSLTGNDISPFHAEPAHCHQAASEVAPSPDFRVHGAPSPRQGRVVLCRERAPASEGQCIDVCVLGSMGSATSKPDFFNSSVRTTLLEESCKRNKERRWAEGLRWRHSQPSEGLCVGQLEEFLRGSDLPVRLREGIGL